jgi:hypothetical protein
MRYESTKLCLYLDPRNDLVEIRRVIRVIRVIGVIWVIMATRVIREIRVGGGYQPLSARLISRLELDLDVAPTKSRTCDLLNVNPAIYQLS